MHRTPRSLTRILEEQVARWRLPVEQQRPAPDVPPPLVTLSRQPGSGGLAVAEGVARRLELDLFDRELIERVADSAHMITAVVETLDERSRNSVEEWVMELMQTEHMRADDYLRHLCKVIGVIARHGRAVIVGRGASFVIPPGARLAVRVIAPEVIRVRRAMEDRGLEEKEARAWVRRTDADRLAFIRRYFGADADDPGCYDLTLNTGHLELPAAIDVVVAAVSGATSGAGYPTGR